jgi:hypothetical protein
MGNAERAWISEQLEHLDEELARLAAAPNVPVVYTGSRRVIRSGSSRMRG